MKLILPMLAVFCFALAGFGCSSTCSSCSHGHDHAAKCCGKCAGDEAKACCGKCGKDKAE